ncbi:MAG: EamA family transporter [Candidatus Diapherotrites archaeon]|nr:EamA family transporter [Candidatus Diapherotrites archaeon]
MLWLVLSIIGALADATKDFASKRVMGRVNPYAATWALLTFTLPFLAVALLFTETPASIGPLFWVGVGANVIFYTAAVLLYMKAINASDLSITLPMIAFTPAFMLLTGSLLLNELPNALGILGVLTIVAGAYLLRIKDAREGLLKPFFSLLKEKGAGYMLAVAFFFSITSVTGKLAINESTPLFAVTMIYLVSMLVFTAYVVATGKLEARDVTENWRGLALIGFFMSLAEIALFNAMMLTLAVYAIAVKRLSILFGSLYGFKFFREKDVVQRLLGSVIMLAGIVIITLS